MNKELTCNQVSALISFYIKGKLNPKLKEYVDIHLAKCPNCRKKIDDLNKILNKFKNNENPQQENKEEYENRELQNKLSAYVDNELNVRDTIMMKKMTISNPNARKSLENIYKYKKAMNNSYSKTKNDFRYDCSKDILNKLQEGKEYTTTYFYKLIMIFTVLVITIIGGFFYLYF